MKKSLAIHCFFVALAGLNSVGDAQEKEAIATAVKSPAASIPKSGPLTVTVEMIGGQKISGTLTEVTMLPIRTGFGAVEVPLAQVAGVKLASAEDPSTTVIMKDGDSITGATDLKSILVDTEWGSAKINGSAITSMLLLPDLKWTASIGLSGKRWSLVDSKAAPQPGQFPPTGLLPAGARPGTVLPSSGTRVVNPNQ